MNFANFRKMLDNIYIYIMGCTESCAICQFLVHFHFQEECEATIKQLCRMFFDAQKAHRLQKSVRFFLLERSNNYCVRGGRVV